VFMVRVSQLGIAVGALGAMLAFMGVFPAVTGLPPTVGVGIVQIFAILLGFSLLIFGALLYVKFTFYANSHSNLGQQIGTRLAMTGLVMAAMASLADVLGFGSHTNTAESVILMGPLQAIGMIFSYVISSIGVLVYAVAGSPTLEENE